MIESYFDSPNQNPTRVNGAPTFMVYLIRAATQDKYGDFGGEITVRIPCRYIPTSERFVGVTVQGESETMISRAILYVAPKFDLQIGDKIRVVLEMPNQSGSGLDITTVEHEFLTVRRKEPIRDFTLNGWKVFLT